jgi:UDPglucose 6-dehydrogenase
MSVNKVNIGVVGNGFVGSALVSGFSLHVDDILIYDRDSKRSTHSLEQIVRDCSVIFVSVPTPMFESGECDLSIVYSAVSDYHSIRNSLEQSERISNQVIVIRSTIVPGTMEKLSEKYPDVKFVFNPEFLTERRARLDFINASRIVLGGNDEEALSTVERIYRIRFPYIPIVKTDFSTAQLIKYMANCFFATKVSFMNEMYQVCTASGGDWDTAVKGLMLDGRIGNSHIDVPGHDGDLGFGGKCFPKDINAMIKRCEELGVEPSVLKGVWNKNKQVRKNLDWYDIPGAVTKTEKD